MSNGLMQGSVISPYLFNVYLDELSYKFLQSNIGCRIGDAPMNFFVSYADELALVAPTAKALNKLPEVCQTLHQTTLSYIVCRKLCEWLILLRVKSGSLHRMVIWMEWC